QSGSQAEFIKQRGMQQVGQGTNLRANLLNQSEVFFGGAGAGFIELMSLGANYPDVHADGGDQLADAVVEFPGEAAGFLIANVQEAGGKVAEILVGLVEFGSTLLNTFLEVGADGAELFFGLFARCNLLL